MPIISALKRDNISRIKGIINMLTRRQSKLVQKSVQLYANVSVYKFKGALIQRYSKEDEKQHDTERDNNKTFHGWTLRDLKKPQRICQLCKYIE